MARIRVTYFFRSSDGPGWSESWHTTNTSDSGIRAIISRYTGMRQGFLHNQNTIYDVRVSDDELFRDILFFTTGLPARGTAGGQAAPLAATAVAHLISQQIYSRFIYTRGHASEIFLGNDFNINSDAYKAFKAWVLMLKAGGFGISHKTSPSTAKLVTDYNPLNGTFTVPGIGSLDVDTPLTLTKVPRSIIAPRTWRVASSPGANQFILQRWPLDVNVKNYGRFRVATPVVTAVSDAEPDSVGERRVGRPFGLPRGRASVIR